MHEQYFRLKYAPIDLKGSCRQINHHAGCMSLASDHYKTEDISGSMPNRWCGAYTKACPLCRCGFRWGSLTISCPLVSGHHAMQRAMATLLQALQTPCGQAAAIMAVLPVVMVAVLCVTLGTVDLSTQHAAWVFGIPPCKEHVLQMVSQSG